MGREVIAKLKWVWNRLTCMSTPEIFYRALKSMKNRLEMFGYFVAPPVSQPVDIPKTSIWIDKHPNINVDNYCDAAENILDGKLNIFAMQNINYGNHPEWNRDPLTGTLAPLTFGKVLNYRDQALVGDIKYLWEPNRHLHLVNLAQAYQLTGNPRYIRGVRDQLLSWFDQCPYLIGPNWVSALEVGIRLINWSIVWQLIAGKNSSIFDGVEGASFRQSWIESIYQHTHFINSHFSRYSSANNHLIGEAAGLYIATLTWPYWPEFDKWRVTAKDILEHEALLQNTLDGVNKEQAISYQQFVLDFLILSGLAGRANKSEFSLDYWNRIEAMLEYLASVMDVAGNIPMIGDADDGYVVSLSQEPKFCPYRSLLSTGTVLFKRGDFKKKAGGLDDKTLWILGNNADDQFDLISVENVILPVHRKFAEGGYYILGADFDTDDEIRIVLDAGPLGYGSLAAHGHADALAFTLSIAGREFLIDPGTYAYHTKQKWRDYFRGTSAHNTVRIDHENQSVIAGNFMWSKMAHTICETWELGDVTDRFVGSHDGYTRLDDPVIHRRELLLNKAEDNLLVTDELSCGRSHKVEQFWHFSENCRVSIQGQDVKVINGDNALYLNFHAADVSIDVWCGSDDPPIGWVSRRFDVKVPTSTIVASYWITGNASLKSSLKWIRTTQE